MTQRRTVRRWRRATVPVLLMALALALVTAVTIRPAWADIPPVALCTELNEHEQDWEFIDDGTSDYVIWECTKTKIAPTRYYWRAVDFRNLDEDLESYKNSAWRFAKENVWTGFITGGFGVFSTDRVHRPHIRFAGSFDLRDSHGVAIKRDMGVHMVAKHSTDGVNWSSCGDTGWKNASSARSRFSYEFWELNSSCGPWVTLYVQAHFYQLSTHAWWTSPWEKVPSYKIIGV
jgi:hypothetical protein